MNGRWIDQFPPEREYDLEIDEDTYELQMADAAAAQAAANSAAESARKAEEIAQGLREEMPTKVSELENDSNYAVDANYVHTDNNFTSSEKNKLEGIAAGAEVNVNADWNATSGDAFILNKPTKVSDFDNDVGYLTEHQDISGKANAADLAAVATSGSYNDLLNKPSIPNKVSDLTDDSGHYTKPVTGIPASDLEETYLTQHQDISMKANRSEIPTAVSQLDNDAGYITGYTETDPTVPAWAKASTKPSYTASEVGAPTVQEMNTAINNAIGSVNSFDVAVVQTLPSENISTHTIYLVPKIGETNDVYDEYIYINNAWEMVGNTQIDLSNYATKSEIPDVPVEDVQINGTSIVADGVAEIPIATFENQNYGVVQIGDGLYAGTRGRVVINRAIDTQIKQQTDEYKPITPKYQHVATFYGLAKAAGADEKNSNLAVGQYTDNAKSAIQSMLGVTDSINNASSMLATVEADSTASKEYAIGDLLVYEGKLYQVVSAISLGDTLIPDGNIELTTVEQQLASSGGGVVKDVQIDGASIVTDGVANMQMATTANGLIGPVKIGEGLYGGSKSLNISFAPLDQIKREQNSYRPITPLYQHYAVFYGLAKAAGSDEKNSTLPAGQYTENAKSAIHEMLNGPVEVTGTTPVIMALPGISYKCGEVATLDITLPASGIVDVVFTSGSTPTVLTATGVTWPEWFDVMALEADTVYEINVSNGYGVVATWPV